MRVAPEHDERTPGSVGAENIQAGPPSVGEVPQDGVDAPGADRLASSGGR